MRDAEYGIIEQNAEAENDIRNNDNVKYLIRT